MRAIIVEDEHAAVINLKHLLNNIDPQIEIINVIETVSEAIDYFKNINNYDLLFMDIQLADGNSFEILKAIKPVAPIIFTTAYDQYAIQAFKVNSVDYLLKPIQELELKNALEKFKDSRPKSELSPDQMQGLLNLIQQPTKKYRQSYLVQKGDKLIPIPSKDFSYFFIQNGVVRGTTSQSKTYYLDGKLEDLENELNPNEFYRANRQYLVRRSAIKDLDLYFNGRLIVNVLPEANEQIIVSKANAPKFKAWLNQG